MCGHDVWLWVDQNGDQASDDRLDMKHKSNRGRMTVGPEVGLVYRSTAHQVFVATLLGV